MNGLKCPRCKLVNMISATECYRCGASLTDLPPTAEVSVPVEDTFQARAFGAGPEGEIPVDVELGRKTFFWYRVYLGALTVLSLALVGIAGFALLMSQEPSMTPQEREELLVTGVVYGLLGLVFTVVYAIALFLPRRSWNWIVGIVFIGFGMMSCCTIPAAVPLLIFWIKPETRAFFGRK